MTAASDERPTRPAAARVVAVLEAEMAAELDGLARRHRDDPAAERRKLLLLALEREQIVAVSYRPEVIAEQVAHLDVGDDLRRLVTRAMAWVQRDEALHVEWVRGRLRRERRPEPVAVLLVHQAAGLVGAWVSTTRTHPRAGRRAADVIAGSMVLGARLTRRISPALAGTLRRGDVERYCWSNVALERTAEQCWRRLTELATNADEAREAERIADDEADHGEVFAAIANVLAERRAALAGAVGEAAEDRAAVDARFALDLEDRLARIGPWYVGAERRPDAPAGVGSGAEVRVVGVEAPSDAARRRDRNPGRGDERVLRAAVRDVVSGAGMLERLREGQRVAIRANFMLGYHVDDLGNRVDPVLLDELARTLRAHGASDVAVVEIATVYDRHRARRSVREVAADLGYLGSDHYRIVDGDLDQVPAGYRRGLGRSTISRAWRDADHRIVVAKAATDPCEFGHLSLATLQGLAGRTDETMYLGRLTDFRSAAMMVLDVAPPDLAVVDAWGPVADGPVGVMGSDRPCWPRRLYAGEDAVTVDVAVLADMGAPPPERLPMLAAASQWLGVALVPPAVAGPSGRWGGGYRGPDATRWSRLVCAVAAPIYTYGGARGARFQPAFDETVNPELGRVRWDVRLARRMAQRVFGLHPPRPHRRR